MMNTIISRLTASGKAIIEVPLITSLQERKCGNIDT